MATTTGGGTSANIDKKDFDIIITTTGDKVPEPATALSLVLATLVMVAKRQVR